MKYVYFKMQPNDLFPVYLKARVLHMLQHITFSQTTIHLLLLLGHISECIAAHHSLFGHYDLDPNTHLQLRLSLFAAQALQIVCILPHLSRAALGELCQDRENISEAQLVSHIHHKELTSFLQGILGEFFCFCF